jgi:hypothetical protein
VPAFIGLEKILAERSLERKRPDALRLGVAIL